MGELECGAFLGTGRGARTAAVGSQGWGCSNMSGTWDPM